MSLLKIYLRVLALLGPEKWLATSLAVANLGMAAVFTAEEFPASTRQRPREPRRPQARP
jgi:hypothetical protein